MTGPQFLSVEPARAIHPDGRDGVVHDPKTILQ
jgi:hypothetical protein